MPGTPFSFSSAFTHNQDNQTRSIDITLPDATLRMNTIYPFKSNKGGEEKWYEKINMNYNARFKNFVEATDTTLFTSETLDNLQTGIEHNTDIGASFTMLKYFNVTTNAEFEQFIFTRTLQRELDPTPILDTIGFELQQEGDSLALVDTTFGSINEFYENGLASLEDYRLSIDVATQLFATKRFSKGWLRGLRHTMKPRIGFSYEPDTESRYQRQVLVSAEPGEDEFQVYNPYTGGAFSTRLQSKQMALTYGINNLFEGKYYSKSDSTEKKFKILNNLNVNGSYNFAADSLKWSPLNISGNTSFFKGITSLVFTARYTYYIKDENGRSINTTVWSQKRRPFEFENFTLNVSNGFTFAQIRSLFSGSESTSPANPANRGGNQNSGSRKKESLGDWVDNFRFNHSFNYQIRRQNNGRDTSFVSAHNIRVSGKIQLTDSWNLSINNISYDLVNNRFIYPQFSLSRDLHCWSMQFSWSPAIEVYSFFIGVKSSSLNFLKYNYGERNAGRLTGFR